METTIHQGNEFRIDDGERILDLPQVDAPRRIKGFSPALSLDPQVLSTALEAVAAGLGRAAEGLNMVEIFTSDGLRLIPELRDTPLGAAYIELSEQLKWAQLYQDTLPWLKRGLVVTAAAGVSYAGWRYAHRRGWTGGVATRVRSVTAQARDFGTRLLGRVKRRAAAARAGDSAETTALTRALEAQPAAGQRDGSMPVNDLLTIAALEGHPVMVIIELGDSADGQEGPLTLVRQGVFRLDPAEGEPLEFGLAQVRLATTSFSTDEAEPALTVIIAGSTLEAARSDPKASQQKGGNKRSSQK